MYKPKVYLAGKITNNWWRNEILEPNWSYTYPQTRTPGISTFNDNGEYFNMEYDAGDFIVTGPHSIGCDHSCFHGENAFHTAGGAFNGCCEDYGVTKQEVFEACTHQIDKADIVFAYIDDKDAYGTLFELGYAYNHFKRIFIVYKNNELAELNWFISQSANKTYILESDADTLLDTKTTLGDIFTEVLNTYNKK